VVETHGRSGRYNPHLHIIMISGGINESTGRWVDLGYFPFEIIHRNWQYHLFEMLKEMVATDEMKSVIDSLYKMYPKGLVAHVTKGKVPERCRGLAKYVASPLLTIKGMSHVPPALPEVHDFNSMSDGMTMKYT